MNSELLILLITTISVGFFHTLLGPDHYLPFIVMAKSGKWSKLKTIFITIFCGLGHVGSSIILAIIGIIFGIGISQITPFEEMRGNVAAFLFLAFGLIYFIWGIRKAKKHSTELHFDKNKKFTPWILFIIFVLGPCEPLIPIIMLAFSKHNIPGIIAVSVVFSIITILTMLSVVAITLSGLNLLPLQKLEKYMHSIAGATIFISGFGILFLEW